MYTSHVYAPHVAPIRILLAIWPGGKVDYNLHILRTMLETIGWSLRAVARLSGPSSALSFPACRGARCRHEFRLAPTSCSASCNRVPVRDLAAASRWCERRFPTLTGVGSWRQVSHLFMREFCQGAGAALADGGQTKFSRRKLRRSPGTNHVDDVVDRELQRY